MNERLNIGIIAPPWVPVPPIAYGGTELMLDALCIGLKEAGHHVTLFTTGDSTCEVNKLSLFPTSDPDRMGATVLELRHVAAAYDAFSEMDIIHDHTLAGPFQRDVPDVPIVTTNHGPFNQDLSDLLHRIADRVPVIAISHHQASQAPKDLPIAAVIHHGLRLDRYPFSAAHNDHVVFLGRMAPEKGVETAVHVARQANIPLVIAAKMREPNELRYYRNVIKPLLGDDVTYVGEADFAQKVRLLSSAKALINPIRWPEPFGLVMAEALACGTPVVGYPSGAAPEIVDCGITGFLPNDEAGLVEGLLRVDEIRRETCRRAVEERFSADRMATDHMALYRTVIRADQAARRSSGPWRTRARRPSAPMRTPAQQATG